MSQKQGFAMQGRAADQLSFRSIRIPEEVDLAGAHRRDSFLVSFGDARYFNAESYPGWLAGISARLAGGAVFALLGDEIVGQIEAQVLGDRAGYINLFYLVPRHRGRGLGAQLHSYAVQLLRQSGVVSVDLAVSPTNAAALRFYEKHGYRQRGLRKNAIPPVIEMHLELSQTAG